MACRYIYQGKTYSAQDFDDVLRAMAPEIAAKYMPGISSTPSAPFVTDTKAWTGLALKRAIAYAVDNGFDKIAWTTGEQQSDRYNLAKQVDAIAASKNPDGTWYIQGEKNGGFVMEDAKVAESKLPDIIGKELAQKIVDETGVEEYRDGAPFRIYRGNDLKVGGEGMKGFYDAIVPQVAKKLGAEVGSVGIENHHLKKGDPVVIRGQVVGYAEGEKGGDFLTQPGFTITDKMREQASSKGMPLFSTKRKLADDLAAQKVFLTEAANDAGYKTIDEFAAGNLDEFLKAAEQWRVSHPEEALFSPFRAVDTSSPSFLKWFGDSKVVDADGKPLVVYHGTTAEFNSFNPLKTPVNDDGYMGAGTYFIDDYRAAESYADMAQDNAPGEPRVVEVYLSIKNPYVMTEKDGQGTYGMTRDEVIAWTAQKKAEGYDGVTNGHGEWVAFSPTQIKSSISNTGEFSDSNPDIRYATNRSALTGKPINQTWTSSGLEKFDNFIRTMQDKLVDTKRVVEEIRKAGIAIKDSFNPYLQEILYHGRSAKQVSDFMDSELKPMLVEMHARGIEMQEMEDYLWARHAAERNAQIAKINTNMPDGGSGLTNQEASDILAGQAVTKNGRTIQLRPAKMAGYQSIAKRVQSITNGTLDLLVAEGLETQQTVDAWKASYKNYIPLMRDMESDDNYSGAFNLGTGKGFSVRGSASKRAMGSDRGVVDILANVAMQRERAITRAEKNKVAMAVYGLSMTAPNPDFWITINPDAKNPAYAQQLAKELQRLGVNPLDAQNIANEPRQAYIDPRTDMTAYRVNPALRNRADVLAVRLNGQDRYVMFSSDERAQHMVRNLKNLDADQLGQVMGRVSTVTRWFASINTQYNPIFGLTNGIRDLGTGALNLSSTSLKGKQAKVMKYAFSALKGIYSDLRDHRAGRQPSSQWALEFEEFQREGGQTGYKDMFATSADRTKALHEELKKAGNGESFWKVFSEDHPVGGWLSDYNTSIENAVRLAAYKAAKEDGLSIEQAAALAKGLTVNFNKKGLVATQAGALYAFFNAAVQGSARIAQTMVKDGKLTSAGQKILYGGLLAGVMQGVMASLAGWDDEEPPQFAREKNFLIPLPDGKYLSIPMPLGFHVIPNIGRISTEFVLSGFKKPGTRLVDLFRVVVDGFNPLGSSSLTQMIAPTVADPIVALSENKDFTGKSIYKEDFNKMKPTAGWTRTKDTASDFSKAMAYGMNYITGGGKHGIGIASPTPDQIDYLIGQATGGLGRESLKMWQAAKAPVSGEELPLYKVPVVGRFVGETTGQASEVSKFYNNLKRIGEHAYTIKSMEEAKDFQAKAEYLRENPDARMIDLADKASRELGYLKRMKRDAVEKGDKEKVVAIEKRITDKVKMYNGRLSEKQ